MTNVIDAPFNLVKTNLCNVIAKTYGIEDGIEFVDTIIELFETKQGFLETIIRFKTYEEFLNYIVNDFFCSHLEHLYVYKGHFSKDKARKWVEERMNNPKLILREIGRMKRIEMYRWVASSNDGSYEDESDGCFSSKEECYNDMRNSALEKMKWNTEYTEDFEDDDEQSYIGYKVEFNRNYIIHESYSGKYTYKIERV